MPNRCVSGLAANHLFANCLIHNVCSLTRLIGQLQNEGEGVPEATLAYVNPNLTEHTNRFGNYVLNMNRKPPKPAYEFSLRAWSASTGQKWPIFPRIVVIPGCGSFASYTYNCDTTLAREKHLSCCVQQTN